MLHKAKSQHKRALRHICCTARRHDFHEKPAMTEHTKTDGLPGMDLPLPPEATGRSPLRNERMSAAKVECNACPVLCQISEGRTGACDRYANRDGVLVRVDPVLLLRRELASEAPALVPFARPAAEPAPAGAEADWNGDLLHADEVF